MQLALILLRRDCSRSSTECDSDQVLISFALEGLLKEGRFRPTKIDGWKQEDGREGSLIAIVPQSRRLARVVVKPNRHSFTISPIKPAPSFSSETKPFHHLIPQGRSRLLQNPSGPQQPGHREVVQLGRARRQRHPRHPQTHRAQSELSQDGGRSRFLRADPGWGPGFGFSKSGSEEAQSYFELCGE